MGEVYWIWVKDTQTGNERWAKNNDGSAVIPLTLSQAIDLCAQWTAKASRHEYSVRKYANDRQKVLVTVEVEV